MNASAEISPLRLRWVLATILLVIEIVVLTSAFTAPQASDFPEWRPFLAIFNEGYHRTAAVIFGGALLLAASANFKTSLALLLSQSAYAWWKWTTWHGLAIATFAFLTCIGLGTESGARGLSGIWLIGWIASGTATFLFWLLIIAPAVAWRRILRVQQRSLTLGALVGVVVWIGGFLTQALWKPLAAGTLRLSALLLSFLYPEISYDPVRGMVGTKTYLVQIMPACSGYEGIALVTLFVSLYLWIFRRDLRFPEALVLFPIGIFSIWITNVLRVSALIIVGTEVSPGVAGQGFHSHAGWIGFTLVTFGLLGIAHRWLYHADRASIGNSLSNRRPEIALLTPLLVLMGTSMVAAAASAGFEAFYPLEVITTAAVLWYFRGSYRAMFGRWSWEPFAIGILVFVAWMFLVPATGSDGQQLAAQLSALPPSLAVIWILFRIAGSVVSVPLAEELAFRGYLIHKFVSSDFENVRTGQFTWLSFFTSSILFGFLHQNVLAGALAGAAFALALYRRGHVGDAIVAHMTSNALIVVAVLTTGRWGLWT